MKTDIFEKLRAEITDQRKLRHDLIMRKFAFLTAFMGTGAINLVSKSQTTLNFGMLLFLVPFIAIAFDLYIFVEDYRIKRAGEFLKQLANHPGADEKQRIEGSWEDFVERNPNKGSTFAFFVVTLIYTVASFLLLVMLDYEWWLLISCFSVALIFECLILYRHIILRRNLKTSRIDLTKIWPKGTA
jgi:hypothetical protein